MLYHLISPRIPQLSILQQVLMNRGIAPAEAWHYLNTTDDDLLDPTSIENLESGVKLLISHIAKNHKIFI
jgi:hypothetical protein